MTSSADELNISLKDIADNFQANVDIKDRKYRLKTYKKWVPESMHSFMRSVAECYGQRT